MSCLGLFGKKKKKPGENPSTILATVLLGSAFWRLGFSRNRWVLAPSPGSGLDADDGTLTEHWVPVFKLRVSHLEFLFILQTEKHLCGLVF